MLNKDLFKNLTLSFLVVSSIYFSLYIFMGDKLWSLGYNFFNNNSNIIYNSNFMGRIISVFGQGQPAYGSLPVESIIKPNRVVITKDGKRNVIEGRDVDFGKTVAELNKIILTLNVFNDDVKKQEIDEQEWFKALKYKSIFVDYSEQLPINLWEDTLGLKNSFLGILKIKKFIIAPGDSVLGKPIFMFMDADNGKIYQIKSNNTSEFMDAFIDKNITNAQVGENPFSFELNFDGKNKSGNQKVVQKVLLDSHVTVNLNADKVEKIKITRPLNSTMQDKVEGIVKIFGFRLGAIKKYVEVNNSVLFVENFAELKVSMDGLIEYQAIEGDKGLKLFEKSKDIPQNKEISESLKYVAGLVQHINRSFQGASLSLSDISHRESGEFVFSFDYEIDGLPYLINKDNSKEINFHAVEVVIKGGKVQSLRQYVRGFEKDKTFVSVGAILKALDKLGKKEDDTQIDIADTFLAYIDNESDEPSVLWCVRLKGIEGIVPIR